ncbi:MAG TPA: ABC transporter permease [Acidobacteriaceae bacterium]
MSLISRLTNLFRRSGLDREIDAELKAHIELRIEDNLAAGMSPEEAHRDAVLRFGNATVMRERASAEDTSPLLAGIGRDVHYAFRQLRHSPGFALTAILTLALGIGANVVVLSVLNALILRPLDLPHADRMYTIEQKNHGDVSQSYPDYLDYRARNWTFADMAAYRLMAAGLSAEGSAKMGWGYEASGNYFDMLGVQPALGRFFHASDEHGPNSAPYIVLSDAFWRSRFHADPHAIGTTADLDKHPFTILGVAPSGFHGTETFLWPDFWMPMLNEQQVEGDEFLTKRGNHGLWILGLLKPGVTEQQATESLNAVAGRLAKQYPATDAGMGARLVEPGLIGDLFGDATRTFLFGILLLSCLVLLAACANLASIFAARAADRSRELAIRLAIGSSRWHILRQLLTEAVLVSLAGGIVGTTFATVLLRALTLWQPFSDFPIHVTVTADARVYGLALLLSIASGVLFGMLPARQIWRTDAARVIRGTAAPVLFRRFTLRDLLLGVQIALCTLLVTASLVALRGMQRSLHAPIGFEPQGAMLASTDMQMAGYSNDAALPLQKRMLQEALATPGVIAAGTVNTTPLSGSGSTTTIFRDGSTEFGVSHGALGAKYFDMSPGYLMAAGTRLMTGRDFTWQDDTKSPKVAVINQAFARKLFGNASALGQHFMTGKDDRYEIVGIVEDGKYDALTEEPWPAVFYPLAQTLNSRTILVFRSQLPPADAAEMLNRILTSIDPALPISIESWPASLGLVLFPARVAAASLGIMGLLAAMLALTGTFGVAAYSVSKRMRELGIRVALGARRTQLMRSALGRPLVLLTSGSIVGLVLGMLTSRFLAQVVYHATSRDPLALVGVVATMALIGLVATWIPARHALSVDPARLLREE